MREHNGTQYHDETPPDMSALLERLRLNRTRVRVYYGSRATGLDWEDVYDVTGRIGRSTGRIKIPLLTHNVRSMGGGSLLDDCIVRIRYANRKEGGDLYRHPLYHKGENQ